jgi:phosphomannomutase
VAYRAGALLKCTTISDHLGEAAIKRVVNWTLKYLSAVDCPVKRGTFIEFRTGMLNISPVGRDCSRGERDAFEEWDLRTGCRRDMVKAMQVRRM